LSIILLAHGMAEGGRIPLADNPNAGILLTGRTVATFMFFSVKGSTGCLQSSEAIIVDDTRYKTIVIYGSFPNKK